MQGSSTTALQEQALRCACRQPADLVEGGKTHDVQLDKDT